MPRARVFISYRRDDAAGYARAVYDELARLLGDERVFMDTDDIGVGEAYADVIARAVGAATVLLVLIGRRWAPERLADAGDLVRAEIAAALASGVRVVPVLLDGTPMPAATALPPPLRELAARNALALDNTRFAADMARLVAAVDAGPAVTRRRGIGIAAAAAVVVAIGAAAALGWRQTRGSPAIDGDWIADVSYDWPNANFTESFRFATDRGAVAGSASFLKVPRTIAGGRLDGDRLVFVTRTLEMSGDTGTGTEHRYDGRIDGATIRFTLQTSGGSPHAVVTFIAHRQPSSR